MDWDGAAKRDYVREIGSVPYWVDLPKPKSLQTKPANTKTGKKLAAKARDRCKPVMNSFKRLTPEERIARADDYRARIRALCEAERNAVPPSRRRFAVAIDGAQQSLLSQITEAVKRAKKPRLTLQLKSTSSSSPFRPKRKRPQLKRNRGLGPVLTETRSRRKVEELHPRPRRSPAFRARPSKRRSGAASSTRPGTITPRRTAGSLSLRGRDRRIRRVVS